MYNLNNDFTGYMIDEASIHDTKPVDYGSIYRSKEFTECMKYFDLQNDMTRKILLSVNEADQNVMMQALASKLYGHIVNKVDDIDFGTIPNSRGDITKIDKYEQLCDCINVLSEVLVNYNQPTDLVDTVNIAVQNLVDRRDMFIKAYRLNIEFPIVTYNTLALAVVSATSLLIASCIEFIKLPDNRGFSIAFDKASKIKGKDRILFRNLSAFNKMCANEQFDKTMAYVIKNNITLKSNNTKNESGLEIQQESIVGVAIGALIALSPFILMSVVLLIREIIYFVYYARTKVSDYFDAQSSLLVMNAYNVENNLTRDDTERKNIVEKQNRIAKFFAKLANALKVKERTAEVKASSDIAKENSTKYTYDDVVGAVPDSANAALF